MLRLVCPLRRIVVNKQEHGGKDKEQEVTRERETEKKSKRKIAATTHTHRKMMSFLDLLCCHTEFIIEQNHLKDVAQGLMAVLLAFDRPGVQQR